MSAYECIKWQSNIVTLSTPSVQGGKKESAESSLAHVF